MLETRQMMTADATTAVATDIKTVTTTITKDAVDSLWSIMKVNPFKEFAKISYPYCLLDLQLHLDCYKR